VDLSVINRPKAAVPHALQLPDGRGIPVQLRLQIGGEGSAWNFDLDKVNPGKSPHSHDPVHLTFGGAEQLRSRLDSMLVMGRSFVNARFV
jgi:hypothetical protein